MILETIEPYVEVLNLVLSILAIFLGFSAYNNLRGDLRKGGGYLLIAVALFGVHEIVGSLEEFGVYAVDGLYAFTELIFIVAMLVSLLVFRNLFGRISKK